MNDDIEPNPIAQYFRELFGSLANFFVNYSTDYENLNLEKDKLKKTNDSLEEQKKQLVLNLQSQKEKHQNQDTDYDSQIKGLEQEIRSARLQGIKEGKPLGIAEGKRIANQATRGLVEKIEQTLNRAAMRAIATKGRFAPDVAEFGNLNVNQALVKTYVELERLNSQLEEDNEKLRAIRATVVPNAVEIALRVTPKYHKIPFAILVREGQEYLLRSASRRFQRKYDGLEIDINTNLNSDERVMEQLNAGRKSSLTIGKNQIGLEPYIMQGKLEAIGIYVVPIMTDGKKASVVSRTIKQANDIMSGIKKSLESLGKDYSPNPA